MLTNHKIKAMTLVLSNANEENAVTITTSDDATYSAAATTVESTVDVNNTPMATTELTELKSMADSLIALHQTYVGLP